MCNICYVLRIRMESKHIKNEQRKAGHTLFTFERKTDNRNCKHGAYYDGNTIYMRTKSYFFKYNSKIIAFVKIIITFSKPQRNRRKKEAIKGEMNMLWFTVSALFI